jgi:hypothetical protein
LITYPIIILLNIDLFMFYKFNADIISIAYDIISIAYDIISIAYDIISIAYF